MPESYHTTISEGGRVVLPAILRASLGLKQGDRVVVRIVNHEIRIAGLGQAVKELQSYCKRYSDSSGSVVDELIAERRTEAERGE